MPRWTYPLIDFVTGERVAENVPFTKVRFSDSLFGKGSFTGEFPVDHPALSPNARDDLGRVMVWPCCNGQPMGAFVLSELPNSDMASQTIPVRADSWFEWLMNRRELYHDIAFLNQDQLSIARDLIRYAVGVETVHTSTPRTDPNIPYEGLPWVQWGQAVSGVYRTWKPKADSTTGDDGGLDGSKGVKLGKLFMDLSDRGGEPGSTASPGFEARPDYSVTVDGDFIMRLTLRSPTIGTGRTDSKRVVFEYPSQAVKTCMYGASAKDFATRVRVVGREKNGKTPTAKKVVTAKLNAGYPLVDATFTTDNTVDSTRLSDKAAARARLATVQTGWALTLDGAKDPQLGTYRLGDWIIIRAKRGNRRVPDQSLRITGLEIEVDDSMETETVTPQFQEE